MGEPRDLELVRKAPEPDRPPLAVGDTCRLNSGSPLLTVIEAKTTLVVVERNGERMTFPRDAVRRFNRVV